MKPPQCGGVAQSPPRPAFQATGNSGMAGARRSSRRSQGCHPVRAVVAPPSPRSRRSVSTRQLTPNSSAMPSKNGVSSGQVRCCSISSFLAMRSYLDIPKTLTAVSVGWYSMTLKLYSGDAEWTAVMKTRAGARQSLGRQCRCPALRGFSGGPAPGTRVGKAGRPHASRTAGRRASALGHRTRP